MLHVRIILHFFCSTKMRFIENCLLVRCTAMPYMRTATTPAGQSCSLLEVRFLLDCQGTMLECGSSTAIKSSNIFCAGGKLLDHPNSCIEKQMQTWQCYMYQHHHGVNYFTNVPKPPNPRMHRSQETSVFLISDMSGLPRQKLMVLIWPKSVC